MYNKFDKRFSIVLFQHYFQKINKNKQSREIETHSYRIIYKYTYTPKYNSITSGIDCHEYLYFIVELDSILLYTTPHQRYPIYPYVHNIHSSFSYMYILYNIQHTLTFIIHNTKRMAFNKMIIQLKSIFRQCQINVYLM